MLETPTAYISLDDHGVVVVRIHKGSRQSVTDASENLATAVVANAGRRRPILVDIRGAQPLAADVRRRDPGQAVVDAPPPALALLVEGSPFGRLMGHVYLNVARPGIPMKLFDEESRALEWLQRHSVASDIDYV